MGRRKKDDELERLEKEIRELKAINRSLLKRVKKLDRGYYREREEKSKKPPREIPTDKQEVALRSCPECHKGNVIERTILDRRWEECSLCDRRTKAKVQEPES